MNPDGRPVRTVLTGVNMTPENQANGSAMARKSGNSGYTLCQSFKGKTLKKVSLQVLGTQEIYI